MIADFLELKLTLDKKLNNYLHHAIHNGGLTSLPGFQRTPEGDSYLTIRADGKYVHEKYQEYQGELSFAKEKLRSLSVHSLKQYIDSIAIDIRNQLERSMTDSIQEAIQESGNQIDGDISKDPYVMLEAIKTMPIDFKATRDKPILPIFIAGPDLVKRIEEYDEKRSEADKQKFDKDMQDVLDDKFREFQEREALRVLED